MIETLKLISKQRRATSGVAFLYIYIAPFLNFNCNVVKTGTEECQMLGPQHEPAIVDFTDSWPHSNQHVSDKLLYYEPLTTICRLCTLTSNETTWPPVLVLNLELPIRSLRLKFIENLYKISNRKVFPLQYQRRMGMEPLLQVEALSLTSQPVSSAEGE